jgi:pimeloyl-ACP methyl ester carboxylesterase
VTLAIRTVAALGSSLAYRIGPAGRDAPPVVLLHPWFGCWRFWDGLVAALRDRQCILPDLYSPARTDWEAIASPEGLAALTTALLEREGIEEVDVIGNSVGGIVAQVIAATEPWRVRRLVLIGTGARTVGVELAFAQTVDAWVNPDASVPTRASVEAVVRMLVQRAPADAELATYVDAVLATDRRYLAAVLAAARNLDLRPQLPAIEAPTLVLRGQHDCARTTEHVMDLLAGIRGAVAAEIRDAGHSPMLDEPAEVARLVRAHLEPAVALA